jgi:hypothetical protein
MSLAEMLLLALNLVQGSASILRHLGLDSGQEHFGMTGFFIKTVPTLPRS